MNSTKIQPLTLDPNRLFSAEPTQRAIAKRLYAEIKNLPIVSPHGHTDPRWFAYNELFGNPTDLLIRPDHYVFRMLYSQGISLETLGIRTIDDTPTSTDARGIWRIFAENYYLFRGTPSSIWLDHVFSDVFGLDKKLNSATADSYFDHIDEALKTEAFRPRALFERFNIECLATTESPLDSLEHHIKIRESGWKGNVITAFRPDPVTDPDFEGFTDNVRQLGDITGIDTSTYAGFLDALRNRRAFFKSLGATSTDHGHPTAQTEDLSAAEAVKLFNTVTKGNCSAFEAAQFRGQMLTEMAAMSIEDGLVMQIHPGAHRNHNQFVFNRFGRDKGCDIPSQTNFVNHLKPLLDKFGNHKDLNIILFTLDETTYSRELAPLAGHYPSLKLGPSWWFHDSPEGMRRFREQITETAGFYNTVGFNDDTRAFLSIPARHDVARRMDCVWLAQLVAEHRLSEQDAAEVAQDLTYNLVKKAYKL